MLVVYSVHHLKIQDWRIEGKGTVQMQDINIQEYVQEWESIIDHVKHAVIPYAPSRPDEQRITGGNITIKTIYARVHSNNRKTSKVKKA